MVRINLLPAEIVERRKYERFYPYVFIAAAILFAVVVIAWLGLQFLVSQRVDSLQQTEETVIQLQEQAAAYAIFQQQDEALKERQAVASKALEARVDMGTLMEEISLVLPEQVWLEGMKLDEAAGATLIANAPNDGSNKMGNGYKLAAATLVRLNSLKVLYDVWMDLAANTAYEKYQGEDAVTTGASSPVVKFTPTAKVSLPATSPAAPVSVPATAPGQ